MLTQGLPDAPPPHTGDDDTISIGSFTSMFGPALGNDLDTDPNIDVDHNAPAGPSSPHHSKDEPPPQAASEPPHQEPTSHNDPTA